MKNLTPKGYQEITSVFNRIGQIHYGDAWTGAELNARQLPDPDEIDAPPIETQGRKIMHIDVNNHRQSVKITGLDAGSIDASATLSFEVESPGARRIEVYCHGQKIVDVPGPRGKVHMKAANLGSGPVVIRTIAYGTKQPYAIAKPIPLFIKQP